MKCETVLWVNYTEMREKNHFADTYFQRVNGLENTAIFFLQP